MALRYWSPNPSGQDVNPDELARALKFFLSHYEAHKMDNTCAYPGVPEALAELSAMPMAVLTNKPVRISVRILEALGLAKYFRAIYGGNSFETKKARPLGRQHILREFSTRPAEAVVIGDSEVDVQTARNAGTLAAVVNYGFGIHDRDGSSRRPVSRPPYGYRSRAYRHASLNKTPRLRSSAALGRLTQCSSAYFPNSTLPAAFSVPAAIIAAVLTEFADSRSMECRLFSLNDSPELHRMSVGGREFVFTGCERAKGRFTATALRSARRHAKLVFAVHPNLAPVTQTMRLAAPRMRTIVCTHGIEVWEPLSPVRRRSLRRANLVLAPSQSTADHVIAHQKVKPERIRVLPWALDPEFEALLPAASKAPLPSGFPTGRVILTVGRWLPASVIKVWIRSLLPCLACCLAGPNCNWPWSAKATTAIGSKNSPKKMACALMSIS